MLLDLDTLIFVGFLVINLVIGLFYGRGVKSAREHAIGNRDFSTNAIATTVIATYVGAGFITSALTETYKEGLYFIIPVLAEPIALIITGYFLVPRMKNFFGKLSIAEAMGDLYGKHVRIITSLCGIFLAAGIMALQFKVTSSLMQLFFGISGFYSLLLSASVVILYSSFGGIKAVTFTDILQFSTFGFVVPMVCLSIWKHSDLNQVIMTLNNAPIFSFQHVLDINNPRFLVMLCLFIWFVIPSLDPAYFQRICMAKGINQAKRSFIIAGFVSCFLLLIVCWISILLISNDPNLDPNNLLIYILENHTHYIGFKGLAAIGLMAALMSTADSYLNTSSVLMTYEIKKILAKNYNKEKELLLLRVTAVSIGIIAFLLSYKAESLFQILVMSLSFYMPIISVPLILAIFGFRSNSKVVLIGMAAGLLTALYWSNFYNNSYIGSIFALQDSKPGIFQGTNEAVPGMLANLIAYMIAHLIYVKTIIGQNQDYKAILKRVCRSNYTRYLRAINNFNFIRIYEKNFAKQEFFYVTSGVFSAVSLFSQAYLIKDLQGANANLFNFIYCTALAGSFVLSIYPILHPSLHKKNIIFPFRMFVIPYILVFVPIIILIINKFGRIQITIFLLSSIVFLYIIRWKLALVILVLMSFTSIKFYKFFTGSDALNIFSIEIMLQFKIIYIFLLAGCVSIAFLKPQQEAYELSEEKIDHLSHTIEDQNREINALSNTKKIFLRNLQHETNTPLTGIYSMSQALRDCYSKLSEEQRIKAIDSIKESSERLVSYVHNLVDVSKLMTQKYKLDIRTSHISSLLEETVEKCQRLYITDQDKDDLEITLGIEPNIVIQCDEHLIKRSFENLIINAMQYCKKGTIEIKLHKEGEKITLYVKDSGIGVPKEELSEIFEPFAVSSKTTTTAGGRGLGLAFVKEAASIHKGSVTVQSDGSSGSCFTMTISASSV